MDTETPTPPDYTQKTSWKLFTADRQDPRNPKHREAIAAYFNSSASGLPRTTTEKEPW